MATDVSPDKQNIDDVFTNTEYYIDFYQREYKWKEKQVKTLLDDLFHIFNQHYPDYENLDANKETISDFPWYYLSTYVTNIEDGKTYVVDGQQRLTTLTLILISLHHMAEDLESGTLKAIEEKIMGHSIGGQEDYWIGHGKRSEPLDAIFHDEIDRFDASKDVTGKNMIENFSTISSFLRNALDTEHKFEMFVHFLLLRVVMVELDVESRTDVPMVFEVINDRGVSLDSHEILKGKLLSKIDRSEVKPYDSTWEKYIGELDFNDRADDFFITYLSSRFAETRSESQDFGGEYHRLIFESKYDEDLKLSETDRVKDFVEDEIPYFVKLFQRLHELADTYDSNFPHVYYNGLNRMDSQYLLTLAVCGRNDQNEDLKIKEISKELDRYFVLFQLNNSYDSNMFADSIYEIRSELIDASPDQYREIFNNALFEQIKEIRDEEFDEPLPYGSFSRVGYEDLNQRFLRYFFMRVDEFIANGISKELQDTRYNLVRNDGNKNGYHIEHILANNEENINLFEDEEEFQRQRHRLGGLLVLNNRDNLSSGNEIFEKKKDTYVTTMYWNVSLREEFTSSKPNHKEFKEKHNLSLAVENEFDKDSLVKRTKDLYKIAEKLWCE